MVAERGAGIDACVEGCIGKEGLTPHETADVVAEIAAIAECAGPCVSKCHVGNAG